MKSKLSQIINDELKLHEKDKKVFISGVVPELDKSFIETILNIYLKNGFNESKNKSQFVSKILNKLPIDGKDILLNKLISKFNQDDIDELRNKLTIIEYNNTDKDLDDIEKDELKLKKKKEKLLKIKRNINVIKIQ